MITAPKFPAMDNNLLLQEILNTTQTMIFWKDTKRRFLGVNQAFLDYYGFASQEVLLGKTDEDMGWHADPDPFQNDEWRVLHEGISTYLVHGKCMSLKGERDILASKKPIYKNGKIIGLVGNFIDVTELYQQKDEIGRLSRRLDGIPGGIAIFQPVYGKAQCISVNKCLAQILGTTQETLIGKSMRELMNVFLEPQEVAHFQKEWTPLSAEHNHFEGTYQFHHQEKDCPIWLHFAARLVREPGDEEFIYCAYTNVNKLIHYEKELQKTQHFTEEKYIRAMTLLSEGKEQNIMAKGHYNFTKNLVLEYSTYRDDIYQITTPMSYDAAFNGMMQRSYLASDRQALQNTIERQQILNAFAAGDTHLNVIYRRLIDGVEPVWMSLVLQTFIMPETGDVEGFSYAYDITEKTLQESIVKNLNGLGYDELGLVYSVTGFWRCYLYKGGNRKLPTLPKTKGDWSAELVRYAAEEVVPEQRERVLLQTTIPAIQKNLAEKPVYTVTHAVQLQNGSLRQKQLQFFYVNAVKETIFYSMSDITEQFDHENEQLAALAAAKLSADKANQSKSNFLSNMSHDLRTPLNGILGFTDLAIQEQDIQKKQEYLQMIKTSGKLLEELVNDTLELSRIESGKLILRPELVDGRNFWKSLIMALIPAAEMKGVRLETDPAQYPAELIKVDQLQVKKVLLNLISNAIKYTPPGGSVKVSVQALNNKEQGFTRRLIVEDSGIGMSEAFMARMYEPFSQEARPEAKNIIGTGLGLSIVKRVVDMMGGRITVESKINKGTRFTVDLPIEHWVKKLGDNAKEQAEKKQLEAVILAVLHGRRILLCEDNYLNAKIATLLLKDKKMLVDWVKDGAQGVAKLQDSPPGYYAAILMDIRMPNLDGYAATKAIRQLKRPDAKTLPIIAMSANAFEEDMQEAEAAGMNGYVTKPINPPILFSTLAQHIK